MKARNGFVSNSSSSSFVVVFPRKPKSVKEVLQVLYGGENINVNPYDFDDGLTSFEIAENVFNDIKKRSTKKTTAQGKISEIFKETLLEQFCCRYYYSVKSSCACSFSA